MNRLRMLKLRIVVWIWEKRYGGLYAKAGRGEYWCGVCKAGHKIGTPCPDDGAIYP